MIWTQDQRNVKIQDEGWHCRFLRIKQLQASWFYAVVIFVERSNETVIIKWSAGSAPNKAKWVSSAVPTLKVPYNSHRQGLFVLCLCFPIKICPSFFISWLLCLLLVTAKRQKCSWYRYRFSTFYSSINIFVFRKTGMYLLCIVTATSCIPVSS